MSLGLSKETGEQLTARGHHLFAGNEFDLARLNAGDPPAHFGKVSPLNLGKNRLRGTRDKPVGQIGSCFGRERQRFQKELFGGGWHLRQSRQMQMGAQGKSRRCAFAGFIEDESLGPAPQRFQVSAKNVA